MSTFEERRAARLARWQGGVARSFVQMDEIDFEQWQRVAPVDRLKAVWSLVADSLALRGEDGPTPRLQRLVGGVRKIRG
jgi:hypothetical protein